MDLIDPDHSDPESCSSRPRKALIEEETSGQIIGGFYHVYNAFGFGYLEGVYSRAMEIELRKRGMTVEREVPFKVYFEGECVGIHRIDMLVEQRVAVEIKALKALTEIHHRQLLNYVTALDLELGMLLHFGPEAKFYRVVGRRKPNR